MHLLLDPLVRHHGRQSVILLRVVHIAEPSQGGGHGQGSLKQVHEVGLAGGLHPRHGGDGQEGQWSQQAAPHPWTLALGASLAWRCLFEASYADFGPWLPHIRDKTFSSYAHFKKTPDMASIRLLKLIVYK